MGTSNRETLRSARGHTWIFGVLRANVIVTRVQNVLVHQCRARRNLSEEADFDGLANLYPLSLLYENLPGILAPILSVQARHAVLLWMVPFFEWLERGHKVMTTSNSRCDDPFGDTGRYSALHDSRHGVHGSNDFGLELRGNVKFDLLEQVFGSTETADYKDILWEGLVSDARTQCPRLRLK